jgi:exodeoxyribonuclease VII small subunit
MATITSNEQSTCAALSFEDAMKRLEEIAGKLENGKATLDESLSLYEEGIALIRHCNEKLLGAEQRIRTLDPSMLPTERNET